MIPTFKVGARVRATSNAQRMTLGSEYSVTDIETRDDQTRVTLTTEMGREIHVMYAEHLLEVVS